MPAPSQSTSRSRIRGLGWRGPALVAGAFALGLLLFAMLYWRDRRAADFYQPPVAPQPAAGQPYEALPAPLPAGDAGNASGMGREETETANAPRPTAPVRPSAPVPAMAPAPGAPPVATATSDPVPVERPAPRYPLDALRNQEAGTVLLRVQVDAAGMPTDVAVLRSSRSRSLDRAATEAVGRWRFRPAQRDGQAVPGSVQVPVAFNLGQ